MAILTFFLKDANCIHRNGHLMFYFQTDKVYIDFSYNTLLVNGELCPKTGIFTGRFYSNDLEGTLTKQLTNQTNFNCNDIIYALLDHFGYFHDAVYVQTIKQRMLSRPNNETKEQTIFNNPFEILICE